MLTSRHLLDKIYYFGIIEHNLFTEHIPSIIADEIELYDLQHASQTYVKILEFTEVYFPKMEDFLKIWDYRRIE